MFTRAISFPSSYTISSQITIFKSNLWSIMFTILSLAMNLWILTPRLLLDHLFNGIWAENDIYGIQDKHAWNLYTFYGSCITSPTLRFTFFHIVLHLLKNLQSNGDHFSSFFYDSCQLSRTLHLKPWWHKTLETWSFSQCRKVWKLTTLLGCDIVCNPSWLFCDTNLH